MGTLAIKDDLLTRIAKLAQARKVPIETQAEKLLIDSIERDETAVGLRQLMDAVAAMTLAGVEQTDSVELLREDRSR